MTGPSPLRDTSNREIRQSVPVRKLPGDDQRMEAGVCQASVVGEMSVYVDMAVGEGDSEFMRRIGRSVGAER